MNKSISLLFNIGLIVLDSRITPPVLLILIIVQDAAVQYRYFRKRQYISTNM